MRVAPCWLWIACLCLGCQAVGLPFPPPDGRATQLWQDGQAELERGEPDQAVDSYERCLAADLQATRAHLSLAAALLEKGDQEGACKHLAQYLRSNPDHVGPRVHYAELLFRLKRPAEAKAEFERAASMAQEDANAALSHLLHCHTRLMEIAEAEDDEYGIHLNRGVGVYYLACQRAPMQECQGKLHPEALLCQAAGELALARMVRPGEARPCWYLHQVWTRLDQRRPALNNLREAEALAPFSHLTAAEARALHMASLKAATDQPNRR
jgi:tetratricopeptide (TPR) repeat protein